eukprot:1130128-Alexandrium_andersonii.AAC.1
MVNARQARPQNRLEVPACAEWRSQGLSSTFGRARAGLPEPARRRLGAPESARGQPCLSQRL